MISATGEIQQVIRGFIKDGLLADGEAPSPQDDDDLFFFLDSLQVLRMLIELESRYAIKVDNSELTVENLGTIAKLAAFISKKREYAAC
jgi:acyl carrier protein